MLKAYINGTGNISPQKTFTTQGFPDEIMDYKETRSLKCIEPAYNEFIEPMASRRMSRIVKMGLCAGLKCLKNSGVDIPGAIITGTGFGCIEDTEKFLGSIISNEEKLLNPTPFIQSTHNTIGAAIALKIKCNNYNSTYVHKDFSFEHALLDGMMLLNEGQANNVLVGGLDETTNNYFTIKSRLGEWKKETVDSLRLAEYKTPGTIAGEGVAFFMLDSNKNNNTLSVVKSLKTFSSRITEDMVSGFITEAGISVRDIDVVIYGINGNATHDNVFYNLIEGKLKNLPAAFYKHLCGEYDTSSAFALWLASVMLKQQFVPEVVKLKPFNIKSINNILIFNSLKGKNHSLILLQNAQL